MVVDDIPLSAGVVVGVTIPFTREVEPLEECDVQLVFASYSLAYLLRGAQIRYLQS